MSGNPGSGGWIRTNDQRINSPLRYRCATPDQPGAGPIAAPFSGAKGGMKLRCGFLPDLGSREGECRQGARTGSGHPVRRGSKAESLRAATPDRNDNLFGYDGGAKCSSNDATWRWRSVADLNRCSRFCRPVPNPSANRPSVRAIYAAAPRLSSIAAAMLAASRSAPSASGRILAWRSPAALL